MYICYVDYENHILQLKRHKSFSSLRVKPSKDQKPNSEQLFHGGFDCLLSKSTLLRKIIERMNETEQVFVDATDSSDET